MNKKSKFDMYLLLKDLQFFISQICVVIFLVSCSSADGVRSLNLDGVVQTDAQVGEELGATRLVAVLPEPVVGSGGGIRSGDTLEITVYGVESLDRKVVVDERGLISMPLIGTVNALGMNARQLEGSLEAAYAGNYLQDPDIGVNVTDTPSNQVTFEGQFVKPGAYAAAQQTTLLRGIAAAGGLTEIADTEKIYISRQVEAQSLVAAYSVEMIRRGQLSDPRLFAGDIVIAFPSGTRVAMRNLRDVIGLASSTAGLVRVF